MAGVNVKKGPSQPNVGMVTGVLNSTTEATTFSINVSTITGYENVTSVVFATASFNLGAVTTTVIPPLCQWTTTDCIIKVTSNTGQSTTATVGVLFIGK